MNKEDKNYWLKRYHERQFLNFIWKYVYPEVEMSWNEILEYINSGRFGADVLEDIQLLAVDMVEKGKEENRK